jgi:DNA-binding MarR family transcriptional regulator
MDVKPDGEIFCNNTCEIDWKSATSPELDLLKGSPSAYMIKILHLWQRKIREMLVEFDLTLTQGTMLASLTILTRGGKHVTQADLATFLKADKMMVSEVLRTLEKKGYVIRQDHPTDRRAKSLVVTGKGREIVDCAMNEIVAFDRQFFSTIDDEQEDLIRILKKLV